MAERVRRRSGRARRRWPGYASRQAAGKRGVERRRRWRGTREEEQERRPACRGGLCGLLASSKPGLVRPAPPLLFSANGRFLACTGGVWYFFSPRLNPVVRVRCRRRRPRARPRRRRAPREAPYAVRGPPAPRAPPGPRGRPLAPGREADGVGRAGRGTRREAGAARGLLGPAAKGPLPARTGAAAEGFFSGGASPRAYSPSGRSRRMYLPGAPVFCFPQADPTTFFLFRRKGERFVELNPHPSSSVNFFFFVR